MYFDRETTVVITKFNNLPESALTNYCQKFGTVQRCFIKTINQTRHKEPYALIKFADSSSANSILTNRHHTINDTNITIRAYHHDTTNSNQSSSNNQQKIGLLSYEQLLKENASLKTEIANLQRTLTETQIYSKTAYDTFQALREKFEAEQVFTNKLKLEYASMVESYEALLKQNSSVIKSVETNKIKSEPIENSSSNHVIELQIIKDHLEQAQIDLGKYQTENALLNAKLKSREQQFDMRYKELNQQHTRLKKQYEHMENCIKDFNSKLYPKKKRLQTDSKENSNEKIDEKVSSHSNEDIVEVVMHVEPLLSQNI